MFNKCLTVSKYVNTEFGKLKTNQSGKLQKLREDFRNMRNEFTELLPSKVKKFDDLKHVRKLEHYIDDERIIK